MLRRSSSANNASLPMSGGGGPGYGNLANGYSGGSRGYGGAHGKARSKGSRAYLPWLIMLLSCILCAIFSVSSRSKYKTYRDKGRHLSRELRKHQRSYEDLESQLQDIEKQHKEEKEVREIKRAKKEAKKANGGDEAAAEKKLKEAGIDSSIERLQKRIQRMSHREVVELFGQGPYFIEMEVVLPSEDSLGKEDELPTESFTIELASVDTMPHSVHFFLEQVYHELWDGCTFVLNAPHIFQAGPHSMTKDTDLLSKFQVDELEKLSFQEYHSSWTHTKYTIGYAGRPAGPDFYINKIDNSIAHGPGGQAHHALKEEADPCFGKVSDGFDVVDKMFNLPGIGRHGILEKRVYIKKAKVISLDRHGFKKEVE